MIASYLLGLALHFLCSATAAVFSNSNALRPIETDSDIHHYHIDRVSKFFNQSRRNLDRRTYISSQQCLPTEENIINNVLNHVRIWSQNARTIVASGGRGELTNRIFTTPDNNVSFQNRLVITSRYDRLIGEISNSPFSEITISCMHQFSPACVTRRSSIIMDTRQDEN